MRFRGSSKSSNSSFSVNIVPIIDCLTILITFMLASGVYISIAVLDIGVSGSAEAAATSEPDRNRLGIEVSLTGDRKIAIAVTGPIQLQRKFEAQSGEWDFTSLKKEMKTLKEKYPKTNDTTLLAHPTISYQDVVRTMDAIRVTHTEVLLGGF